MDKYLTVNTVKAIILNHTSVSALLVRNKIISGALFLLILVTAGSISANDTKSPENTETTKLVVLPAVSEAMDIAAEETESILGAVKVEVERVKQDPTTGLMLEGRQSTLLLTGLDSFIAAWNDETDNVSGSSQLLGAWQPLTEIVRDHQAFLMLEASNTPPLRILFLQSRGLLGPMKIGGLTPAGRRDHLVAMMLMEAARKDPTEYPYQQYDSRESLAIALLTGQIDVASIPVSQAVQMPLDRGIEIIATSSSQPQDILRNVPTLLSARLDLVFADFIGLYTHELDEGPGLSLSGVEAQLTGHQWKDQTHALGLVDDYDNDGIFTVNVLRELVRMKRFADMLE